MGTTRKTGPLCMLSVQLGKNPDFRVWIGAETEAEAAEIIRCTCQVSSRSEIDRNAVAAELFHRHVRRPFAERAA